MEPNAIRKVGGELITQYLWSALSRSKTERNSSPENCAALYRIVKYFGSYYFDEAIVFVKNHLALSNKSLKPEAITGIVNLLNERIESSYGRCLEKFSCRCMLSTLLLADMKDYALTAINNAYRFETKKKLPDLNGAEILANLKVYQGLSSSTPTEDDVNDFVQELRTSSGATTSVNSSAGDGGSTGGGGSSSSGGSSHDGRSGGQGASAGDGGSTGGGGSSSSGGSSHDGRSGGQGSDDGKSGGQGSNDYNSGGQGSKDYKSGGQGSNDYKSGGQGSNDNKTGGKGSNDVKNGGDALKVGLLRKKSLDSEVELKSCKVNKSEPRSKATKYVK